MNNKLKTARTVAHAFRYAWVRVHKTILLIALNTRLPHLISDMKLDLELIYGDGAQITLMLTKRGSRMGTPLRFCMYHAARCGDMHREMRGSSRHATELACGMHRERRGSSRHATEPVRITNASDAFFLSPSAKLRQRPLRFYKTCQADLAIA